MSNRELIRIIFLISLAINVNLTNEKPISSRYPAFRYFFV